MRVFYLFNTSTVSLSNKLTKIVGLIKESFSSENQDYTQGSIPKAVFLLAVPMILELSLESVFALVDIFFVSKLGENAIATVGLTESVITIVYSVAIGLSTAATAIVARRVGEKNHEQASQAGIQALLISLVATLLISILGVVYAHKILELMGASQAVISEGTVFTQIMMGGSVSIMLLFLINGIFRGAGNAAMAMKSLWLASIINIILCPILIHFWGLKGAAIATVIGRSTGVLYQLYYLFKGSGHLQIKWVYFKPDWSLIKSIVEVAYPATLQFILASGSWIILAKLVAETGGTGASAGYQIAIRNIVFFILPAWGLSNAAATLVGQNLGAKQVLRAEQSVWICTKYNAIFMAFVMVLFLTLAEPIMRLFTQQEELVSYGAKTLQVIGIGYIFYGISMVMMQALNGAGDTKTPTYINLVCFWLIQVPMAYVLAVTLDWGVLGVLIAIPTAEILLALASWYFFRAGKWKTIEL